MPFEASRNPHQFIPGTCFEQVLNHYLFDRELRLHLLDAIERIEISFRTQWAFHISHKYGPHGYLINNNSLRKSERRLLNDIKNLTEQVQRSDEVFIKHYHHNYDEDLPALSPSVKNIASLKIKSHDVSQLLYTFVA